MSLAYEAGTGVGKTMAHVDSYHGRFAQLVPDERVVEIMRSETGDPNLRGDPQTHLGGLS